MTPHVPVQSLGSYVIDKAITTVHTIYTCIYTASDMIIYNIYQKSRVRSLRSLDYDRIMRKRASFLVTLFLELLV